MKVERCKHDLLVGTCADCSGLSDEVEEAIQQDKRVVIAIMARKRASGSDAPQQTGRYVGGYRGTEVARRWGWK